MQQTTQSAKVIGLNAERFGELLAGQLGSAATQTEKAEYLGLERTTLYRVLNGGAPVGERFIVACLSKFDCRFEDLFELRAAS